MTKVKNRVVTKWTPDDPSVIIIISELRTTETYHSEKQVTKAKKEKLVFPTKIICELITIHIKSVIIIKETKVKNKIWRIHIFMLQQ